jgi:hypothetical protein
VKSVRETRHFLTDEPSCKNTGIFSGDTPLDCDSTIGTSGNSGEGTIDDGREPTINHHFNIRRDTFILLWKRFCHRPFIGTFSTGRDTSA